MDKPYSRNRLRADAVLTFFTSWILVASFDLTL
jgi:hypothetical protein